MGKIKTESAEEECKDGESIVGACETLGVPFGCYAGACGACKITILEGAENLSDITDEENTFGVGDNERLACQCKLKSGEVKIKF